MAIALVQSAQKVVTAVSSTTLASGSNLGSGDLCWLASAQYNNTGGATISTPTATSHTFTADGAEQQLSSDSSNRLRSFYEANCASGPCTVTFAVSSGTADISCVVSEWSGVATSTPLDQFASHETTSSTSPSSSATGTRAQADEVLLGAMNHDGTSRTITEGTGFSLLQEHEGGSADMPIGTEYWIVSATGTDAATWTIGTGNVNSLARVATF